MKKLGTNIRMRMIAECCGSYINNKTKILDIGAGNGYVSYYLQNKFGCRMHCADIMNYLEYDFPFSRIHGTKLPFRNNAFDVAMINDTLHHMKGKSQIAMLKEAARVAKKVIIFETERTFIAMLLDRIMSRVHNLSMPVPCTHKTRAGWKMLFSALGFRFGEIRVKRKWFYPLEHSCFIISS